MRIREEAHRVRLDLAKLKPDPRILSIWSFEARCEGAGHTALANALLVIALRIWESETRRPRRPASSLVDVCCGTRWRLIGASYIEKDDFLGILLVTREGFGERLRMYPADCVSL